MADQPNPADRDELLFQAWSMMEPDQRRIVWLDLVERRSLANIAEAAGLHPAAVPAATAGAREALRRMFSELERERGGNGGRDGRRA